MKWPSLVLAAVALSVAPLRAAASAGVDEAAVRQLNDDYVRAFLNSDVGRFGGLLSTDFTAVLADGRLIDRRAFLLQAASRPDAVDFRLHEVVIRVYSDSAILGALVTYRRAGGEAVRTRYTALFVLQEGRLRIASVQWTRAPAP
jgi:ketosteroid isomerase-like protein